MEIGQQLRAQREGHHLSQSQLATALHISRQSISKWENGTSLPSFANVVAISELFDVTLDDLIKGDAQLMAQLAKRPKASPVSKIVSVGLVLGVLAGWQAGH